MTTDELIRRLRSLAAIGIVNHKEDTALIRLAADLIEDMDERIGIMEDGNQVTIAAGANVDLMPLIEDMERKTSGLIEEE